MTPMPINAFNQLQAAHQEMEIELHSLVRRRHPTPIEAQRTQVIKKLKLRAKDKMRVITTRE